MVLLRSLPYRGTLLQRSFCCSFCHSDIDKFMFDKHLMFCSLRDSPNCIFLFFFFLACFYSLSIQTICVCSLIHSPPRFGPLSQISSIPAGLADIFCHPSVPDSGGYKVTPLLNELPKVES
ncbi:hypothetical protein LZ32DRAFT_301646 [Colletotrichum eremochloae]|nr:hypothetical protein LZ32DRAFT_301646 [Colletotrichum eremochloae]